MATARHALRAIAAGAYDFCEKPIDIQVLGTIVQRSLRLRTLEDENRRLSEAPAAVADQEDRHRRRRHAEGLPRHREAGRRERLRAAARRERDRQGGAGPRAARSRAAGAAALRRHQLRRDPGEPARERAVRPRAGRVHRRGQADAGPHRDWPIAARCSSTRSATCRIRCRSSCCASCRTRWWSGSAAVRRSRWTCGWSPPPTSSLQDHVDAGRFRGDLFYRLNPITLRIPPLRERGGDPVLLARYFLGAVQPRVRPLGARLCRGRAGGARHSIIGRAISASSRTG